MRWLRILRGRRATDRELRSDLQFHLEQAIGENLRNGMTPDEARRVALAAFGNPAGVIEEVRDQSFWTWWERLAQDVRYGLRGLSRSPVFAVTAVISLGLGIGANTAIFSVMDAALLRPLPATRADRLVLVTSPKIGDFGYQDFLDLRTSTRTLSDVIAASTTRKVLAGFGTDTDQVLTKIVSGNYFEGLGVSAALGRTFTLGDETEPVVVLSRSYWMRRFGGDARVVGQNIRLDGLSFAIVGVAPSGFFGEAPGESPEVWASVALLPVNMRKAPGFTWLNLMGRLKPTATIDEAQADLAAVMARLHPSASPDDTAARQIVVVPGARGLSGLRDRFNDSLLVLMAIVGLVLLIACTNLGGLLVARGAARQKEIATRLAIGASRARVVRQLMTENLLLAVAGAAFGLIVAVWSSSALLRLASGGANALSLEVGLDGRVLFFTGAVSIAACLLFGLAPAIRAVRQANSFLLASSQRTVGRGRRWTVRDAFIVAQIALSLVLLTASTLFIRTLRNLEQQDLGFGLEDRLQVQIARERSYRPAIATLVPALLERVAAIPGVASASIAMNGVLAESGSGVNGLQIDGYAPRDAQDARARADWVGPDYFRTVGIRLLSGREFTLSDTADAQKVAVVNETWARHYFGGQTAVGRRFTFNKTEYQIVGVARDAKYTDLREPPPRVIYFALLQTTGGVGVLEIRSAGDPLGLAEPVRAAIREVDPHLAADEISTPSARLDRKLAREHMVADLATVFSALTLLLVSIGVYGTLAYSAARRMREIGVRLALGSRRVAVVWIMMRDVVVRLAVGVIAGAAGVFAAGRLVGSLLFGLQPDDGPTLVIAITILGLVAFVAGVVPTVRASRLDPARVLRE
jgi:predicted permease